MDNPTRPGTGRQAGQQGSAAAADLWRFAPLTDFRPPSPPVSSAAGRTWSSLTWLFGRGGDKAQPLRAGPGGTAVAGAEPNGAAGPASGLVRGRGLARPRPGRLVAAGPTGAAGALSHRPAVQRPGGDGACWGTALGATVITEPTSEQILGADCRWLEDWPDAAPLWVLPRLERCFLRHAGGLSLVRRLLDRAQGGTLGCGLIGCDSWAWAFLEYAWPVVRPDALAVQAFDGEGLARLLAALATPRAGSASAFAMPAAATTCSPHPLPRGPGPRRHRAPGRPLPRQRRPGRKPLAPPSLRPSRWGRRGRGPTQDDQPAEVIYVADAIPEIRPSAGCSEEILLLHGCSSTTAWLNRCSATCCRCRPAAPRRAAPPAAGRPGRIARRSLAGGGAGLCGRARPAARPRLSL